MGGCSLGHINEPTSMADDDDDDDDDICCAKSPFNGNDACHATQR